MAKQKAKPTMQPGVILAHEGGQLIATTLLEAKVKTFGKKPYVPFAFAAAAAHTTAKNLHDWIKRGVKFDGKPVHTKPDTDGRIYVSQDSVTRMSNRFVKWPSMEPVQNIVFGHTEDKSGFLGLPQSAPILGVNHHTLWRWLKRGTLPKDMLLDVVLCTTSKSFFIRESCLEDAKRLIPEDGLSTGRRPSKIPRAPQAGPSL